MTISFNKFYKGINPIYKPYLDQDSKVMILWGGASSGKSFFEAQRIICLIMLQKGRNFLILRKVDRANLISTFPQIKQIIYRFNVQQLFKINETTHTITYIPNGNQIIFKGLNNIEDLKSITFVSGPLTDVWIEEASQISQEDFNLVETRLRGLSKYKKQIVLTFNPVSAHNWIKEYFFDKQSTFDEKDLFTLHTTHKDNAFLLQEDRDRIESLKNRNFSFYQIYGLGLWGALEGLIFQNYEIRKISKNLFEDKDIYAGLDFGMRHPSVLTKSAIKGTKLYVIDELYMKEQSPSENIQTTIDNNFFENKRKLITADSSRPDLIKEWRASGFANMMPSKKGPGSVKFGLDFLRNFKIIVDESCSEFATEIASYCWKQTRDGRWLDEPVGFNDDGIDSLRYATESLWTRTGKISSISASSFGL